MDEQRFHCEGHLLLARTLIQGAAQDHLAAARRLGHPVLCACRSPGVPMVLRRYNGKIIVARWPDTGDRHATECPSFDSNSNPAAIREHPDGTIEIRTSFQLAPPAHARAHAARGETPAAPCISHHDQLDLSGVLHELWRRAGFDKWFPSMHGKRNWGVVRYHVAEAASAVRIDNKTLGDVLVSVLPFQRGARDALNDQLVRLHQVISEHGIAVLLVPVKLVAPSKFGFRFEFYHLPKLPFFSSSSFSLPERLRRLPEGHRLVALALVDPRGKHFRLHDIGAISVTPQWLPYDHDTDICAIEGLAATAARFVVRHGHLRTGCEIAIHLGGFRDGRLIFPDPESASGFRFDKDSPTPEIHA